MCKHWQQEWHQVTHPSISNTQHSAHMVKHQDHQQQRQQQHHHHQSLKITMCGTRSKTKKNQDQESYIRHNLSSEKQYINVTHGIWFSFISLGFNFFSFLICSNIIFYAAWLCCNYIEERILFFFFLSRRDFRQVFAPHSHQHHFMEEETIFSTKTILLN